MFKFKSLISPGRILFKYNSMVRMEEVYHRNVPNYLSPIILMSGLKKHPQMEDVEALLEECNSANEIGTLIEKLVLLEDGQAGLKVFDKLKEREHYFTNQHYGYLATLASFAGDRERVIELNTSYMESDLQYEVSTIVLHARAMIRVGDVLDGVNLLQKKTEDVNPLIEHYNELLMECLEIGRVEDAQELFELIKEDEAFPMPNSETDALGIVTYSLLGQYDEAMRIYKPNAKYKVTATIRPILGYFGRLCITNGNRKTAQNIYEKFATRDPLLFALLSRDVSRIPKKWLWFRKYETLIYGGMPLYSDVNLTEVMNFALSGMIKDSPGGLEEIIDVSEKAKFPLSKTVFMYISDLFNVEIRKKADFHVMSCKAYEFLFRCIPFSESSIDTALKLLSLYYRDGYEISPLLSAKVVNILAPNTFAQRKWQMAVNDRLLSADRASLVEWDVQGLLAAVSYLLTRPRAGFALELFNELVKRKVTLSDKQSMDLMLAFIREAKHLMAVRVFERSSRSEEISLYMHQLAKANKSTILMSSYMISRMRYDQIIPEGLSEFLEHSCKTNEIFFKKTLLARRKFKNDRFKLTPDMLKVYFKTATLPEILHETRLHGDQDEVSHAIGRCLLMPSIRADEKHARELMLALAFNINNREEAHLVTNELQALGCSDLEMKFYRALVRGMYDTF